jgi:colicin import membrane protein
MNLESRSFLLTIILHVAVLVLFLFAGFRVPLPLPAEKGILINFGDVDEAGGKEEPKYNMEKMSKAKPHVAKEPAKKVVTKESLMTQDYEEAPSIKEKNKSKKKEVIKKELEPKKITTDSKSKKAAEEVKEPEPVVNKNALYKGRKQGTEYTGSEGVGTGKGNQGSLSGSENATDHSLGTGSGSGTTFSLDGRNPVSLPKPDINTQKEGRVVVEIKVDRAGNVISAVPGVKGSTTLENSLMTAAKRAALASKFDTKTDAAYTQTGTITYIFKF